jgi:hypothetical protein
MMARATGAAQTTHTAADVGVAGREAVVVDQVLVDRMALRPWASVASITSRTARRLARSARDPAESVDTPATLTGRFARSVDTSAPLAGFAASRRRRSARIGTPAARRYPLAVSRADPELGFDSP